MDWIGTAGSSKMAPRIMFFKLPWVPIFYIHMVKNIEIWVSAFFKHNNSFVATMTSVGKLRYFIIVFTFQIQMRCGYKSCHNLLLLRYLLSRFFMTTIQYGLNFIFINRKFWQIILHCSSLLQNFCTNSLMKYNFCKLLSCKAL